MSRSIQEEVALRVRNRSRQERRELNKKKLPFGALLLEHIGVCNFHTYRSYQVYILVLTFNVYVAYRMSRKAISVVAHVWAPNCSLWARNQSDEEMFMSTGGLDIAMEDSELMNGTAAGWPPFNGTMCKTLIGGVDSAMLFTYALVMIVSGAIADRVSLRYFLAAGMIGSGVFTGLLGVAYFGQIHELAYFIVVQVVIGAFQSTGWPGLAAVNGNWFGKRNRGLVLGIWNAHTSIGNILGTVIPAIWAKQGWPWGWSFLVPAFVMIFMGVVVFFFLVTDPAHVGLPPPTHHLEKDTSNPVGSLPHGGGGGDAGGSGRSSVCGGGDGGTFSEDGEEVRLIQEEREREEELRYGAVITTAGAVSSSQPQHKTKQEKKKKAIGILGALKIPGVIEYSLALFFAKLVSYTFMYWLPYYVANHPIGEQAVGEQIAALLASLFDVGGIVGSITTGAISDLLGARAISCVLMMYLAVPTLFLYRYIGLESIALTIVLILLCGTFINGPYALITTAVSNDLGTHKVLKENQKAKATVGAIIDATGSLGAAIGPLITGWISDAYGWGNAFYVLMGSCFLSSLMLSRVVFNEIKEFYHRRRCMRCTRGSWWSG